MAQSLEQNPRANPGLSQQAADLAKQQQQLAQQFEQLAQTPGAAAGGQGGGSAAEDRGEEAGDLQTQVKKLTGRNWGQLSSKLKTELTQAAKHQAHGDYSKLIKLYFQEIAKTQGNAPVEAKP